MMTDFAQDYFSLTGHWPFPWQQRLYEDWFVKGKSPAALDIPTGLGKTSVMGLWLVARATGVPLPRRLIYVVDRRVVVDQATTEAQKLREALENRPECKDLRNSLSLGPNGLAISTLRGETGKAVDSGSWLDDPSAPAIVVGTVDMIGSRLLFGGYGAGRGMRPYLAGFLGADCLVVLDEAHLVPPFESLLRAIAGDKDAGSELHLAAGKSFNIPPTHLMTLSATGCTDGDSVFRLHHSDEIDTPENETILRRLNARKALTLQPDANNLVEEMAKAAISVTEHGPVGQTCIIYADRRDDAERIGKALAGRFPPKNTGKTGETGPAAEIELLVGARRVKERVDAERRLQQLGLIAGSPKNISATVFLVATSAGEVGIDLDADHMVCDLVPWERMVQRLGRVNRRGEGAARVIVVRQPVIEAKDWERPTDAEKRAECARRTGDLLGELPLLAGSETHNASPNALRKLRDGKSGDVAAATTHAPLRPALTKAHVEAWSMTSLEEHPGRAEIGPWLRGWVDDPPQATIVWRRHLPVRDDGQCNKSDIEAFLEKAPIGLAERLETEGFRVIKWLEERANAILAGLKKQGNGGTMPDAGVGETVETGAVEEEETAPADAEETGGAGVPEPDAVSASLPPKFRNNSVVALLLDPKGGFDKAIRLDDFADKKRKDSLKEDFARCDSLTLIVRADVGGLREGLLAAECAEAATSADADPEEFQSGFSIKRCQRRPEDAPPPAPDFTLKADGNDASLVWLEIEKRQAGSNGEDERSVFVAHKSQSLREHVSAVVHNADRIGEELKLPTDLREALVLAARLHDHGKNARRWQDAFYAPLEGRPYGKVKIKGGRPNQKTLGGYRHEFGSLLDEDVKKALAALDADQRDLVAHLIAAHHGQARPLMRMDGVDCLPPSALKVEVREIALRFARLQQKYGPWGLAWLEALLRSADQRASAETGEPG